MGTAEPIGISPHWGPAWCENRCGVLHRPIRVFVMWYGVFSNAQKQTVRSFVASLSPNADSAVTGRPSHEDSQRNHEPRKMFGQTPNAYDGNHISQSVTWGGEVEDRAYSKGKTLLTGDVEDLLGSAISSQQLPYDPRAVYFLLSDAFVTQKWGDKSTSYQFCRNFCGWHHYSRADNYGEYIYSWAGKADLICPFACIPKDIRDDASFAPTGDPGMDGLVSVFAHEFAEATSSPFISTWFDGDGYENADKCAWKFTPLSSDASGIKYNLESQPAPPGSPPGRLNPTQFRGLRDDESNGQHMMAGRYTEIGEHADRNGAAKRRLMTESSARGRGIAGAIEATLGAHLTGPKALREDSLGRTNGAGRGMANLETQRASAVAGAAGVESTVDIGKPTFGISPHWCADGLCGVLHRPIRVFVMWYGVFSDAQKQTVRSFVASLSPNADSAVTVPLWWNVNRQYHDQAGRRVTETVTWGGETDDAGYSRGATLHDADVTALNADVTALNADAITSGRLPYDADGVYFVLSDASVAQAGSDNPQADRFCVAFCGWHFFGSAPGFGTFISAWTGMADLQVRGAPHRASLTPTGDPGMDGLVSVFAHECPASCIAADIRSNASLAPTGDPGMDGLVSVLAHELAEAAASPLVSLLKRPPLLPHLSVERPLFPARISLSLPLQCPASCIAADIRGNASLSPTGDPGMDGLVSVFAHELAEAAASPFVSTWFDSDGEENADKCSWMFAPILTDPSGARYNLVGVNGSKFLIQHNWDLASASCHLTLPYPPPLSPPPPSQRRLRPLPTSPPPVTINQAAKSIVSRVKAVLAGRGRPGRRRPPRPPVVRVHPSTGNGG
ncbi:unnamed protein product [Closterium sp. Naga37s-1]|nr:unnamed protein product [Closterium sp. Naga37s-1]